MMFAVVYLLKAKMLYKCRFMVIKNSKYKMSLGIIFPNCFCNARKIGQVYATYTVKPVLRGHIWDKKSGLIRQVTSLKRFNSYEFFIWQDKLSLGITFPNCFCNAGMTGQVYGTW